MITVLEKNSHESIVSGCQQDGESKNRGVSEQGRRVVAAIP